MGCPAPAGGHARQANPLPGAPPLGDQADLCGYAWFVIRGFDVLCYVAVLFLSISNGFTIMFGCFKDVPLIVFDCFKDVPF